MERGAERLRPRHPRQAARRRGAPQGADADHGRPDDQPRRLRLPRRPALRHAPPAAQAAAVPRRSAGADQPDKARVLVDPGELDKKGTTAIDWYVPSPDGKLVAVSLSKGGTETGDVHVYDTDTAKEVYEVVPRVNGGTAGGDLAWAPDGKGFFYTRYPRGKERPAEDIDFYQQVYFHALGTPTEKDRYELGKDLPRIAEIKLEADDADRPAAGHGAERRRRRVRLLSARSGRQMAAIQHASRTSWFRPPSAGTTTCSSFRCEDAPRGKLLRLSVKNLDPVESEGGHSRGQGHHRHRFPRLFEPADGAADGDPAVRHLPARRTDGGALLRLRRQAARRAEAVAHLHRRRADAPDRRRHALLQRLLRRAAERLRVPGEIERDGEAAADHPAAGEPERRRGGARVRHEQGRHEGAR